ncbi:endolytic transglycosylase MltG [Isoptericola jiangsuensis]|uniref:endolytic transglycosylase MltG n=1 Tax=Isoptericola jiangsuensis TaxID=548579 RepID=UPI003AAB5121
MTDLFEPSLAQRPASPPPSRGRSSASKRAARKRKRRRQQRTFVILLVLLGILGVGGYYLLDRVGSSFAGFELPFGQQAEDYSGPGGDPVQVVIPEGATGSAMGSVLADADVVASVAAFNEAFDTTPGSAGIQPGTYELPTQIPASEAVQMLVANEKIETKVTIPEGFVAEQVIDKITSVTNFSREEVEAALGDADAIGLPKQAGGEVEGWLFPKQYVVQPGDTAVDLVKTMVSQTIAELESAGVPKSEWEDTLNKASMVEREAMTDEDRGKVARVLENRLAAGERLGIDATLAYGLGKPAHEITVSEWDDASLPYNTRQNDGLPPTPIANPGAASIEAVAAPPEGDWRWYVTVNLETGETKFTGDYNEFLEFRGEYQEWAAENGY